MAHPPKSIRKKMANGSSSEGTHNVPLLLLDWFNVQLHKYCYTCVINFANSLFHKVSCLAHIRYIENSFQAISGGPVIDA